MMSFLGVGDSNNNNSNKSFSTSLKNRIYGNYVDESLYLPTFIVETYIFSQGQPVSDTIPQEKVSITIFPKRKSFRSDLSKYEQAFIDYMVESYQDNNVNILSILGMRLIELLTVDNPADINVRQEHNEFLHSEAAPERLKFFFFKPVKASMLASFKQKYSILVMNDKKVYPMIASNRIIYN